MDYAPIVVFAYNRPHYLKETLEALSRNKEAAQSDLYIYCDGPKENAGETNLSLIKEVRELAHLKQWCKNVYVRENAANMGLSMSVTSGVTHIVNQYGKIIVLEDDIVTAPFFLKYMNEALDIYKNEEKVISVSGHNFPIDVSGEDKETLFLKLVTTWGWATWKRGWDMFNPDANELINEITDKGLVYEFDLNNTYPYFSLLKKVQSNQLSSWGVCWYANAFLNKKLSVFPMRSMVKNIGMQGTNFNSDNVSFTGSSYSENIITKFDNNVEENVRIKNKLLRHFKIYHPRRLSVYNLKRLFSQLKQN